MRRIPFYPLILAVYPILSLLAINVDQIYLRDALKPALIALISATILLVVLRIIFRDWQIAALLASLLMVWFFVYGHLYNQIKNFSIMGQIIGRHRYLILVWTAIIVSVAFLLIRSHRSLPNLILGLNLISLILISIPLVQVGAYQFRSLLHPKTPVVTGNTLIAWTNSASPPDIYYIVLDGYGRADALESVEGIDNSAFINSLQQMGFYVAQCSQSNYTRTLLSLASTFNMDYVQSLDPHLTPDQDTSWLYPYLKHSLVRQQLEGLGYKTIVFENPWEAMVWEDAAIVYRPNGSGLLSPFEYLLLSTTVVRVYLDTEQARTSKLAYYDNYEDTLFTLEQLQKVPEIPGPKFVFVHLVIPHSPFVFGANGEFITIMPYDTVNNLYTKEDHQRGYAAAVTYINKRMLEILPKLIRSSKTQPIIILAGDHGTGESNTVTQNLEAFYTPGSQSALYATITPVNIFRLIFDSYFKGNFGLLTDNSYFSAGGKYFNFQEIPNHCNAP